MIQFNNIHLLINPVSGKGSRANKLKIIRERLKAAFPDIIEHTTSQKGDAEVYAGKIKYDDTSLLIICGGDGTINEVVNGLGPDSKAIFCVLPIGSGNDFCKTAGYDGDISKLIDSIKKPKILTADLGHIEYISNESNQSFSRYFASSSGIGFDALVALISNRKSFLKGLPLYLSSVFIGLNKYSSLKTTIRTGDSVVEGRKFMLSFGNGRTSGGGFLLTPEASLNDGKLDMCTVDEITKLRVFSLLPKAITGKHVTEKEVNYSQISKVSLKIDSGFIVHFDGEVETCEPGEVKIRCEKAAVKLLK